VASQSTSEIGAISRATTGLLDIVADTVEHTHTAISSRVFDALGPLGLGVRSVHDGITRLSYRAVRTSLRGAGALAGAVADHHPRLRRLRPLETTAGVRVLSAASGIVGDRLADDHPCLDLGMEVRHEDGRPYPDTEGITSLHHADTLVVFIHGLCEDENSWQRRSRAHRAAERDEDLAAAHVVTHGQRLAHAHGMTPLYVRYNTGRRVHANGARLADALEHVVATWPTEVRRVVLVGHSMGGLVARSACHHAIAVEQDWVERVSNLVYLGTPHLGAPLARGVHGAARWLARLPETRGVTRLLDHRSDGVRDLTTGRIVAQPAADETEAALQQETDQELTPLPDVRHHLLAATITRDPDHPVGRLLGDFLVRADSGSGRTRTRDAGLGDDIVVQGGIDHFDLLSDPAVGDQLVEWLAPSRRPRANARRNERPARAVPADRLSPRS
jgi:pimeloyl-ACP methyl ester carboxylesterase